MQASGKRLQQFIQDFLTYSALETGGLKMHYATGNINQCLSDVCRLWSTRFQEKGLALYFLANDKLPEFPLDSQAGARDLQPAGKLLQVYSSGRDGLVARRTQHVGAPCHRSTCLRRRTPPANHSQPNSVKVSVSDTGPGIPAEFSSGSLSMTSSACRATKIRTEWPGPLHRPPPGSGYGWKSLGGKRCQLRLQIFIPYSLQSLLQSRCKRKESVSETAKILLVDDEPAMLRYIRTLLEVDDYKVETASTGEEALQRLDKGMEPDLVLLDVLMPGIDGLETLEQIRHKRPGTKVVMLSCVNDTKKVVQAMRLGAHDYLTKPFQKAELDAVIDQCLGQGKTPPGGEVEEVADDVFFIAASRRCARFARKPR